MFADVVSLAKHRSFGFDASTKFGSHLQTVQCYTTNDDGSIRTLHAGAELMTGETAELGADAVIKRFESVAFMGKEAGAGYEHAAGLTLLHFAGEAGAGEGVMTDHKEDATVLPPLLSLLLSLSLSHRTCPRKGYARSPGCGSTTSSLVRNGKTPVTSWPPARPLSFASSEGTTGPRLGSSENICFFVFCAVVELSFVSAEC